MRFGPGCTKEMGMDFANMGLGGGDKGKVLVVTDETVEKLLVIKTTGTAIL